MKKTYRYPKNETGFIIKKKKKLFYKDKFDFKKIFKLHDYIKLSPKDFNLIDEKKFFFDHFNLEWTGHKKGQYYLIVKIIKKGSFDGKVYKAPIISSKKVFFVKCIGTKNKINYDDLRAKDFIFSLKNIKNKKELKKAIIRRYKKSLPHISENSILKFGVAITKLRVLHQSSLINYLE